MEEDKNAFMKKLLPLFLTFIFTTIFSQEYHFDYSIESQTTQIKPDKEKSVSTAFYDSTNKIHLNIDRFNDQFKGIIYDKNKNLRHVFKVIPSKDFVTFEYMYTNDFSKDKHKDIANGDILEIKKMDSLQYQIIGYKNEKKTKKRFSVLISLEKSTFDYLELGIDHGKTDEMQKNVRAFLDPNSNYAVKRLQVDYHSTGYSYDSSLKIINVDFSLKLPKELIIKEYNVFGEFQN